MNTTKLTKLPPNLFAAVKIFLSPPVSVASAVIAFGVTKKLKNFNQSKTSEKKG
jgi:hypothetical protein